jgi:hypothetical protein
MVIKQFEVAKYILFMGHRSRAAWGTRELEIQGYVACYGADGSRFVVYGLHPDSPVPFNAVCDIEARVGAIFVPFDSLPSYVDIVRNEKPVYATLNSENPNAMGLSTSEEPVGEGEPA